jgi:excisionase family DNA binding protein
MPVPVCTTVREAYDAGVADARAQPQTTPEMAAELAALLLPLIEDLAARRQPPPLLTVAQAAAQLGLSESSVWVLMRSGELPSVEIPSARGEGKRVSRRIRQADVDELIDRHTVRS